jgi:hypothetical protein
MGRGLNRDAQRQTDPYQVGHSLEPGPTRFAGPRGPPVLHDVQEVCRNRHPLEHADLGAAGVPRGHLANGGSKSTECHAESLAEDGDGISTASRDSEHEPVRADMWTDELLAEDVRALEVSKCLLVSSLPHQNGRQGEFVLEGLPVGFVHVGLHGRATEDR